jgi:hypothetical protein
MIASAKACGAAKDENADAAGSAFASVRNRPDAPAAAEPAGKVRLPGEAKSSDIVFSRLMVVETEPDDYP